MSNTPEVHQDRRSGGLTFNAAAVFLIVSQVLILAAQWYNTKAAVASAQAELSSRIQSLDNYKENVIVPTVKKVEDTSSDIATIRYALKLLLDRSNLDGSKILSAQTTSGLINSQ